MNFLSLRSQCLLIAGILRSTLVISLLFLPAPVSASMTEAEIAIIRSEFNSGIETCRTLDIEYRVDCLRVAYEKTTKTLTKRLRRGSPQISAMTKLTREMARIVRVNADKGLPRIKQNRKKLRAVTSTGITQAQRAIEAAQTVLLKAESKAALNHVRIGDIVGSSKVLLRS